MCRKLGIEWLELLELGSRASWGYRVFEDHGIRREGDHRGEEVLPLIIHSLFTFSLPPLHSESSNERH